MPARVLVLARDAGLRAGLARLRRRPALDVPTADSAGPELAPWDPAEVDGVLVDAGLHEPGTARQLAASAVAARRPRRDCVAGGSARRDVPRGPCPQ